MPRYTLFADYFSFMIRDKDADPDFSERVTDATIKQMMDVLPGAVSIGTVRNMEVPVEVVIATTPQLPPSEEDMTSWDRINECSIDIPSGVVMVVDGTGEPVNASGIAVTPGLYGVRVYYGGLDTLRNNDLDGDDRYRIVLWPVAAPILPHVYRSNIFATSLEQQHILAQEMGFEDVEKWRVYTRQILDACAKESARVERESDLLDTMSPEDRAHAKAKFDEPAGWGAVPDEKSEK